MGIRLIERASYGPADVGRSLLLPISRGQSAASCGAALQDAYAAAKAMSPTSDAPITLLLPDATYDMTTAGSLVLDTPHLHVSALAPDMTIDWIGDGSSAGYGHYCGYRKRVKITAGTAGRPTVVQAADYIRLTGFTIHNSGSTRGASQAGSDHGFLLACDNPYSRYAWMDFAHGDPNPYTAGPTRLCMMNDESHDWNGTWLWCTADRLGWRCSATTNLRGRYLDCYGGGSSWVGDQAVTSLQAYMMRCHGGHQSFSGCTAGGSEIGEDAELWYCHGDDQSFAHGNKLKGKLYYCRGGYHCFGGKGYYDAQTTSPEDGDPPGTIYSTALLVGCRAKGGNSFCAGGCDHGYYLAWGSPCGMKGRMVDCHCDNLTAPMQLSGGSIEGGRFNVSVAGKPVIRVRTAVGGGVSNATLIRADAGPVLTSEVHDFVHPYPSADGLTTDYTSGVGHTKTLSAPLVAATLTITYKLAGVTKTLTSDGTGNLTGDGSGTVNPTTGALALTILGQPDALTFVAVYEVVASVSLCQNRGNQASPLGDNLTDDLDAGNVWNAAIV